MTPSTAPSVELLISPRENRAGPLYPDQAANFDLALRNAGKEVITVNSLQGNLDTPVIRIAGPDGPIGAFTRRIRKAKMVGHGGTVKQKSPSLETLAPGKTGATWVNLLAFHAPLPPGTYSFNVVHDGWGLRARSDLADQKFDIVPVHVADTALGYDFARSFAVFAGMARGSRRRAEAPASGEAIRLHRSWIAAPGWYGLW